MKPYYDQDGITIYYGDSREILPTLDQVDVVFTSPPYNKGWRGDHRNGWEGSQSRAAKGGRFVDGYGESSPDAVPWPEYFALLHDILGQSWELLADDGIMWVNHKPRVWMSEFWSPTQVLPNTVKLRQVVTWDRGGGIDISERGYASSAEWLMYCPKPHHRISMSESARGDVWRIPQTKGEYGHPAPFPLLLPTRALQATAKDSMVLDPFMGSGTTLRAAKDLGRKAIGIEIEERWCEIAANRMAQGVLL